MQLSLLYGSADDLSFFVLHIDADFQWSFGIGGAEKEGGRDWKQLKLGAAEAVPMGASTFAPAQVDKFFARVPMDIWPQKSRSPLRRKLHPQGRKKDRFINIGGDIIDYLVPLLNAEANRFSLTDRFARQVVTMKFQDDIESLFHKKFSRRATRSKLNIT
jgi:hypothetical protein